MGVFLNPGNLAYDEDAQTAYIPNEEIRSEFEEAAEESKWDEMTALDQIKEKKYPEALNGFEGEVLLVGINYDKKTKEHSCVIEKLWLNRDLWRYFLNFPYFTGFSSH